MKIISISAGDKMIIRAGRVFNGHAMIPGRDIDIAVTGGVIREVRPSTREISPAPNEGAEVFDLREYTLMPGLIDCHVHLALDGTDFNRSLDLWRQESPLMERIAADLRKTLSRGIVAVRDGGDREGIGLAVRNEVARGALPGPRILASGTALGRQGKYGAFLGPGLQDEPVRAAVADLARRGVDQIKVLVSGVVSFKNYRQVGPLQFEEEELREIVSGARRRGLRVMAHASSDGAVRMAVRAGVDSLEHGYFISEESLQILAGAGIPWVPTLAPVACQVREPLKNRYSPAELEIIRKTYLRQQRMVKKAADLGVLIGAGTDAGATGVPHGEGLLDELLLLKEAGLSGEEVLRAATSSGASILGLENKMGTLRTGLPPCLIAVRGNPLDDLNVLKNVEFMILPSRG